MLKNSPPVDILCKVDRVSDAHIPLCVNDISIEQNQVNLTITVPLDLLDDIRNFFDSALTFSRYIKKQSQIRSAAQRIKSESYQAELKQKRDQFTSHVVAIYDRNFLTCSTPRQAIRQTRDVLNKHGQDVTSSIVELIVRQAGRLSARYLRENTTKGHGKAKKS